MKGRTGWTWAARAHAPAPRPVPPEEEWQRIAPVIESLASDAVVCVDTSKPVVARRAAEAGARVLNDVTGLRDPEMAAASHRFDLTVVMHMRGTPRSMSSMTDYTALVTEVRDSLLDAARRARSGQVAIDPGIGFAKTAQQSLRLLDQTHALVDTGLPVYIGASRKKPSSARPSGCPTRTTVFLDHSRRSHRRGTAAHGSSASTTSRPPCELVDLMHAIDNAGRVAPMRPNP